MADFNQSTTTPTRVALTPGSASLVTQGTNNTGFGISPTYVNASEFADAYLQGATEVTRQALVMIPVKRYYSKPPDGQLVPFQLPEP